MDALQKLKYQYVLKIWSSTQLTDSWHLALPMKTSYSTVQINMTLTVMEQAIWAGKSIVLSILHNHPLTLQIQKQPTPELHLEISTRGGREKRTVTVKNQRKQEKKKFLLGCEKKSGEIKRKKKQEKPGCEEACRNKCRSEITKEKRTTIFHSFGQMGWLQQRGYLIKALASRRKLLNFLSQNKDANGQVLPENQRQGYQFVKDVLRHRRYFWKISSHSNPKTDRPRSVWIWKERKRQW